MTSQLPQRLHPGAHANGRAPCRLPVAITVVLVVGACRPDGPPTPAASASAPTPPTSAGPPLDPARVAAVVNPSGAAPYSGPTGTVRGVVRVEGPEAPSAPEGAFAKLPPGCEPAKALYGRAFREGPGRTLADALVAVTGYSGYLPARAPAVRLEARDCGFSSRTVAITFGQRVDVQAMDARGYMPGIAGKQRPVLVAIPGRDPVALYPVELGSATIEDAVHPHARATLFVLRYPTHAVTGLDGRFEIPGVPAGEVKVSALLPLAMASAEKTVRVQAGATTEVELTVTWSPGPNPSSQDSPNRVREVAPASSNPPTPSR